MRDRSVTPTPHRANDALVGATALTREASWQSESDVSMRGETPRPFAREDSVVSSTYMSVDGESGEDDADDRQAMVTVPRWIVTLYVPRIVVVQHIPSLLP